MGCRVVATLSIFIVFVLIKFTNSSTGFSAFLGDMRTGWPVLAKSHLNCRSYLESNRNDNLQIYTSVSKSLHSSLGAHLAISGGFSTSRNSSEYLETEKDVVSWKKKKVINRSRGESGSAQSIVDVSLNNYLEEVVDSAVSVIIDVHAEWCGPCKQLAPILEKAIADSKGLLKLVKIDGDKNPELVEALGVTGYPTLFASSNRGTLTAK
jgi:thiol-disulfide isomerase/thioredoxin